MANIETRIEELLQKPITKLGYSIYDVEYTKEGKEYFLRIFIDKIGEIDLEDCEKVSNEISDLLDEANYINEQYFLEVSSPGIERILRKDRHLEANIGVEVEVNLFKPINKEKQIVGILDRYDEECIILKIKDENIKENNNEDIKIERKNIALIKTKYNW